MSDRILARLQFWLQGHGYPPPRRPWTLIRIGNKISDYRFRRWKRNEGTP